MINSFPSCKGRQLFLNEPVDVITTKNYSYWYIDNILISTDDDYYVDLSEYIKIFPNAHKSNDYPTSSDSNFLYINCYTQTGTNPYSFVYMIFAGNRGSFSTEPGGCIKIYDIIDVGTIWLKFTDRFKQEVFKIKLQKANNYSNLPYFYHYASYQDYNTTLLTKYYNI